ncbi:MAG: hypothetical protein ACREAK_06120 [Nitrosarchaeum sp.]
MVFGTTKMKTRRGAIIILVCSTALSITGFSLSCCLDTILFPSSGTPLMMEFGSIELFLVSNRSMFVVFGISGIMASSVAASLLLWPRH